MKRVISAFLTLIFVFTLLPVSAIAAEGDGGCTLTDGCTLADGHEGSCSVPIAEDLPAPAEDPPAPVPAEDPPVPADDPVTDEGPETDGDLVAVTSVTICTRETAAPTTLTAGGTLQLDASVLPDNATNPAVIWSSGNEAVATVSETGLVTAVADGIAIIRAAADRVFGELAVTVVAAHNLKAFGLTGDVLIESITISAPKNQISLTTEETLQLSATILPTDATNQSIAWESSDTDVATVDAAGLVSAIAAGSVTITATAQDGSGVVRTYALTVTVPTDVGYAAILAAIQNGDEAFTLTEEAVIGEDLTIDALKLTVGEGGSLTIPAGVTLTVDGKQLSVEGTGTVSVAGRLDVLRAEMLVKGTGAVTVSGTLYCSRERDNWTIAALRVQGHATVDIVSGGSYIQDNHTTSRVEGVNARFTAAPGSSVLFDQNSRYSAFVLSETFGDNVTGLPTGNCILSTSVTTETDMRSLIAKNGFLLIDCFVKASMTLTDDLTVPSDVRMWIQSPGSNATVRMTVPAGKTVTVDAGGTLMPYMLYLFSWPDNEFLSPNITISIENWTGIGQIAINGTLINNGLVDVSGALILQEGGVYRGDRVRLENGGKITEGIPYYLMNAAPTAVSVTPAENSYIYPLGATEATLQLYAAVTPAFATDDVVLWSIVSGDETMSASITEDGLLTVHGAGSVTVRAAARGSGNIYTDKTVVFSAETPTDTALRAAVAAADASYTITDTVKISADLDMEATELIVAAGGVLSVPAGVTLRLSSATKITGGTVIVNGTMESTSNFSFTGGSVTINGAFSWVHTDETPLRSFSMGSSESITMTVNGSFSVNAHRRQSIRVNSNSGIVVTEGASLSILGTSGMTFWGGSLTIAEGASLSILGTSELTIWGGSLSVAEGATFNLAENAKIIQRSTENVSGVPKDFIERVMYVSTAEDLSSELALTQYRRVTILMSTTGITLANSATIRAGTILELQSPNGKGEHCLTIPAGITLTVEEGGRLNTSTPIITVDQGIDSSGIVITVNTDFKVCCVDIAGALVNNGVVYMNGIMRLSGSGTYSGNAVIAAKASNIHASIPREGLKVTSFYVTGTGNATAVAVGGTLAMRAQPTPIIAFNSAAAWSVTGTDGNVTDLASINAQGVLTGLADGEVIVTATAVDGSGATGQITITIGSGTGGGSGGGPGGGPGGLSGLGEAIANNDSSYTVDSSDTLTENTEIPEGMTVTVAEGGCLTVPDGKVLSMAENSTLEVTEGNFHVEGTLENSGSMQVSSDGTMEVSGSLENAGSLSLDAASAEVTSGGTLENTAGSSLSVANGSNLTVDAGGTLDNSGTVDVSGASNLSVAQSGTYRAAGSGARMVKRIGLTSPTITGVDTDNIDLDYASVTTVVMLTEALSAASDYRAVSICQQQSITLPTGETTVTSSVNWSTAPNMGGEDKTLTIPNGGTLTVNGTMSVEQGWKIVVESGAVLDAHAGTIVGESDEQKVDVRPGGRAIYPADTATDTALRAAVTAEEEAYTVTDNLSLSADLNMGATHLTVASGASLTVPAGVTLTIPEGGMITNNGSVSIYGTLILDANAHEGNRVDIYTDGSATAPAGSCRTEGRKVIGITITGPSNGRVYTGEGMSLMAAALPADAWDASLTWSITEGSEYASIDAETGLLTGIAAGTVTVRATANDGSGVYGEAEIEVVDYSIEITGENTVTAGRKLALTGAFVPENLTDTTLVWTLADGDEAYATLTARGEAATLTAKAVTEAHTVTVTAAAADGAAAEATFSVNIVPLVSVLQLEESGESAAGKTLTLDANEADETERQLVLDVSTLPEDAMQGATATLSAQGIVTVTANEEGTQFVIDSTGTKLGTVTLTFKAKDGSGKSAAVKINVVRLSQGLAVTDTLGDGGKLTAGKRTQLTATFTGSMPSNKAVTWVLDDECTPFAALSTAGQLTAKAVTAAETVRIKAVAKDGNSESDWHEIAIVPLAGGISILRDGEPVTGTTVTADLNDTALTELMLDAELYPAHAQSGRSWTSSDTRGLYATYTRNADGTLTVSGFTGKTGTVTVTAKATDGSNKSAVVKIQFTKLAQEVNITALKTELRGGESLQLQTDVASNRTLTDKTLVWTLSDNALPYASISAAGRLTTKAVPKTTVITVTAAVKANPAATDSVEITLRPAVQALSIEEGSDTLTGKTIPLHFEGAPVTLALDHSAYPDDAIQAVTWKSGSTAIATVNGDGVVTAKKAGTVTITAKATDGSGKTAFVKLVIGKLMEGLTIENPSGQEEIRAGKYVQLKAAYTNVPTNKAVVWSLKDPADAAYASVSGTGRVTAKTVYEPHDVTVAVKAKDNGSASVEYTVRVLPASNALLNILTGGTVVTKQVLTRGLGSGTLQLTARTLGAEADEAVTWKSSGAAYASVSATGLVTLRRNGTATITATAADKRTATVTLKIVTPVDSVTVTSRSGSAVSAGKTLTLTTAVLPKTATNKAVTWSVSHPELVTVSAKGVLTAKAGIRSQETVTVTATAKDGSGQYGTLDVTVYPLSQSLSITRDDKAVENTVQVIDMNDHPTVSLDAVQYPTAANQAVTWGPTNTKGAAYMDQTGTLHLVKAGTVTVTAKAKDGSGKSASFKVTVLARAKEISVGSKTNTFELRGGGKLTLYADFGQYIPTNRKVTWRLGADDAPYAAITASGQLTARNITSTHTVTVTVTSQDDPEVTATQDIPLWPSTASVQIMRGGENVSKQTFTINLAAGERTLTFGARNLPTSSLQDWTWTSSNTRLLTVDDSGTVTAQPDRYGVYKPGTVTVTAKAADGSGRSMTVKVVLKNR